MKLSVRRNYQYALACLTSMGVRLTPENRKTVQTAHTFYMQATSAETNVLNISSSLGLSCLALTKFVRQSPIAGFIKAELASRNIKYMGMEVEQEDPWGYRHQFNLADSGCGLRAPRVWNDRSGEVGRTLKAEDFDMETLFAKDGVGILHLSGLIAAMSEETAVCCLKMAEKAHENGTLISFDLNYRASFWKGREERLKEVFGKIASFSDILIGNEEDFQLCLGLNGPEPGGKDLERKAQAFYEMIEVGKETYPNAKLFATTLRQVLTAQTHLWGAVLSYENRFFTELPREIPVMDRIGGGDGFTGGLLYGVLKRFSPQQCLQFGWGCGALAVSGLNDYAQPEDEKQVWDIYEGNVRVQR